ncbi:MAG: serine hydrolase [Bacteroidota bacterium]
MNRITPIAILAALCLFIACGSDSASTPKGPPQPIKVEDRIWNTTDVFPRQAWEVRSPESQGVNPRALDKALKELASFSGEDGIGEVVVIRNGYLIHQGENASKRHNLYSCTKSFASMTLGLMLADRRCRLQDSAFYFSPLLRQKYRNAQLFHFTTMTSGYDGMGTSRFNDLKSQDWSLAPYAPADPLFAPGTAFAYWDEAQMMFGRVLTRAAREDLKEMLQLRVMGPIALGEWDWQIEGSLGAVPIRSGATGIEMNALQLARIGWLYLNRGRWGSRQLLPPDFVEQATMNQVPVNLPLADTDRKDIDGRGAYGFNWWVNGVSTGAVASMPDTPAQTFYMSGFNNNMCFVIPEWNMVFVRTGTDGNPGQGPKYQLYNQVFKELAKGVKGSAI